MGGIALAHFGEVALAVDAVVAVVLGVPVMLIIAAIGDKLAAIEMSLRSRVVSLNADSKTTADPRASEPAVAREL
jgi:hypothetical protein